MTYNIEDYLHDNRLTTYPAIGTQINMDQLKDLFLSICPYTVTWNNATFANWSTARIMNHWCINNCEGYWTDSILLRGKLVDNSHTWWFQYEADAAMFKLLLP